mgnify:CR=1 FL=1
MAVDSAFFLPNPAKARAQGLLDAREPLEVEKLCALLVFVEVRNDVGIVARMHETYVPDHVRTRPALFSFEADLEASIGRQPPPCLRVHDLRPQKVGGAYRAAQTDRPPDFHGHLYGSTIDEASEALRRFFLGHPNPVKYQVNAFAWPFVWLRYPDDDILLVVVPTGEIHVHRGQPATE